MPSRAPKKPAPKPVKSASATGKRASVGSVRSVDSSRTPRANTRPAEITNTQLAQMLTRYADEMERVRANPYRAKAYRKAAEALGRHPRKLTQMLAAGEPLTAIPGVGASLARLLEETLAKGHIPQGPAPKQYHRGHMHAEMSMPAGTAIRTMMRPFVESLVTSLEKLPGVHDVIPTGPYRRRVDIIDRIDLVVACDAPKPLAKAWSKELAIAPAASKRADTVQMKTQDGIVLAVRFAVPADISQASLETTGPDAHVRTLKAWAKANAKSWPNPPKATLLDEGIYKGLGLPWIAPELRGDGAEIELAAKGKLPRILEAKDIRGDLHTHTDATDGSEPLEGMVAAAEERGLEYIAVTDHTQRTKIARGLDPEQMRAHLRHIDAVNDESSIRVLKGAEVDILKGGKLDLPDDVLDELEVVVCSLHHRDNRDGRELTQRVLAAMEHERAHILGHPSGRLIGKRPPMDLDWPKLMESAEQHGWAFEIDGQYDRMDLNAELARAAAARGIRFSIASDAHSVKELDFMWSALDQSRRGWVDKSLVLNAMPVEKMLKALRTKGRKSRVAASGFSTPSVSATSRRSNPTTKQTARAKPTARTQGRLARIR